ncbi:hypothetical protein AGABI2DRAFT_119893 [Agaricus bisporus var. bisporus H97]|uniref:hypothetical protein n=1 Tax=Agaricus bisporus var. bisporus (strain H97 / ATCC MYA-4626 / FGSC 10389) TaxID=936046 RepID=UPI00029F699A|nr:hypothetical protein AGABI2DRAFT_119893 [Agaricus bisporus var. bisporus H97]EKV44928.1 hypothetical protein AGABI2DRAFT_119893 [Agaricus bisporus var. bisporus H97]
MADHRDRPYPARPSRPSSPTGSHRSRASQSSTHSRIVGAFKAATSSIKSLGSPKRKRKNFITAGFEEIAREEKTLMERADEEIVPTSQEYEKELDEMRKEIMRARRNADDSDEEEVEESSDEENDVAKAAAFSTPPAELMTTPPLPSPLDASQSTTPPHTHEVLPDLDKTPTTPRVIKITEAEAYALKVRAANNTDSHIMTGVSMSSNQFEENVNKSKEIVGEIRKPKRDPQQHGRVTPRMATNPNVIAKALALFVSRIINSEWADVNTPVDIPPPPPVKNVKFAPTPIPTPASAPTPMEVDASPPRITASAKGKKKASPLPPTPQHPVTTSPVIASPIKISVAPKPLVQPSKTGKQGKPVTSYMPIKLLVVTKPTVTNKTLAGVTPRMPESGSSRQAKGRDASGSNTPLNPPKSGKGAPGKSGAPTTAEHGNRSGPPPVPLHSKPNALSRSAEMKNNAHVFAARVAPKSYAQAAKQSAAPTAPAPIDALKAVAPVVNTPPSSNEVIVPKSKKALTAQKAAQGITGGLNRKSAQFAFSHIVQSDRFGDMGKVVNAMNRYLVFHKSQMRVQNGRLFKNVVHFYLNLVPSKQGFMLIRELLYKALEVELPEGDSDLPNAPQSVAHLILKGFDYYTSQYNKRPEDILTGDQVIEAMGSVDQFRGLECVRRPAVVRSRGSRDMAVAFVDVWDSKTGSRTKDLVNKVYHIRGKLIKVEYTRQREFVPQCQKCWKWMLGDDRTSHLTVRSSVLSHNLYCASAPAAGPQSWVPPLGLRCIHITS